MRIFCTDHYVLPLPSGHRFPMRKYAALRERVTAFAAAHLRVPDAVTDGELVRVHDPGYIAAVTLGTLVPTALRRIGFPWSAAMVERSRRSAGATIAACRAALDEGCGVNLAGGTHHAHRDFGAGFCVFNDIAVAARAMQATRNIARVLVVDLDVHQGDGTATIFSGDATVFTFSMHGRNNFPFRKAASDLDIELEDGTGDAAYLAALEAALPVVLQRAQPGLALYVAGADAYAGDRLGRLALSKRGLATRDGLVLDALRYAGVPIAIVMGGGYATSIDDVVDIHVSTVRAAWDRFGRAGGCGHPKPRVRVKAGAPAAPHVPGPPLACGSR